MPISFCLVGLLSIFILFFSNPKSLKNILIFIGLFSILAGYFVPPVIFEKFSLNLCVLLGSFMCLICVMTELKGKKALMPILCAFILSAIYLLVCAYDYNYLIYFQPLYLALAIGGFSIFQKGVYAKLSFSLLSFLLCELLSILVVGNKLLFYPLFTPDTILCIVPIIYAILILCIVLKSLKRRRKIGEEI